MMVIYTAVTFLILMLGAKSFALIFVDPSEIEILEKTELLPAYISLFLPDAWVTLYPALYHSRGGIY